MQDRVNGRNGTLKEFVGTLGHDVQREMSGVVESGKAHARMAASDAGDHLRANIWGYVATSAALGLLAGVWLTTQTDLAISHGESCCHL